MKNKKIYRQVVKMIGIYPALDQQRKQLKKFLTKNSSAAS